MSTHLIAPNPLEVPHVGPAHHRLRNSWIAGGMVAIALAMSGYSMYWRRHNTVAGDQLARFQAAYAERCDGASYPPEAAALARKLYLGSSTLQREVDRQLAALEAGASCEEIYRALRAVDFPQPSEAPSPRAAVIDVQTPSGGN